MKRDSEKIKRTRQGFQPILNSLCVTLTIASPKSLHRREMYLHCSDVMRNHRLHTDVASMVFHSEGTSSTV